MFALRSRQTRICGGLRESEQNELTVVPCSWPRWRVVITVTPEAKCLNAWRNSACSILTVEPPSLFAVLVKAIFSGWRCPFLRDKRRVRVPSLLRPALCSSATHSPREEESGTLTCPVRAGGLWGPEREP